MENNPFAGQGKYLQGAITHNEMVISYIQAGFTRPEAIAITTDMLKHRMQIDAFQEEERRKAREEGQL